MIDPKKEEENMVHFENNNFQQQQFVVLERVKGNQSKQP